MTEAVRRGGDESSGAGMTAVAASLRWSRPDLTAGLAGHAAEVTPGGDPGWLLASGWRVHGVAATGDGRSVLGEVLGEIVRAGVDPGGAGGLRLVVEAAAVCLDNGDTGVARRLAERVLAAAPDSTELRLDARLVLVRIAVAAPGPGLDVERLLAEARADAGALPGVGPAAAVSLAAAAVARAAGRPAEAVEAAEAGLRVCGDAAPRSAPALVDALAAHRIGGLIALARMPQAREAAREALAAGGRAGSSRQAAQLRLVVAQTTADDPDAAGRVLAEAADHASAVDAPGLEAACRTASAELAERSGALDVALREMRAGMAAEQRDKERGRRLRELVTEYERALGEARTAAQAAVSSAPVAEARASRSTSPSSSRASTLSAIDALLGSFDTAAEALGADPLASPVPARRADAAVGRGRRAATAPATSADGHPSDRDDPAQAEPADGRVGAGRPAPVGTSAGWDDSLQVDTGQAGARWSASVETASAAGEDSAQAPRVGAGPAGRRRAAPVESGPAGGDDSAREIPVGGEPSGAEQSGAERSGARQPGAEQAGSGGVGPSVQVDALSQDTGRPARARRRARATAVEIEEGAESAPLSYGALLGDALICELRASGRWSDDGAGAWPRLARDRDRDAVSEAAPVSGAGGSGRSVLDDPVPDHARRQEQGSRREGRAARRRAAEAAAHPSRSVPRDPAATRGDEPAPDQQGAPLSDGRGGDVGRAGSTTESTLGRVAEPVAETAADDWLRSTLAELDRMWGRAGGGEPSDPGAGEDRRAVGAEDRPPVVRHGERGAADGSDDPSAVGVSVVIDLVEGLDRLRTRQAERVMRDLADRMRVHLPSRGRIRDEDPATLQVDLPGRDKAECAAWLHPVIRDLATAVAGAMSLDPIGMGGMTAFRLRGTVYGTDGQPGVQLVQELPEPGADSGRGGTAHPDDLAGRRAGGRRRHRRAAEPADEEDDSEPAADPTPSGAAATARAGAHSAPVRSANASAAAASSVTAPSVTAPSATAPSRTAPSAGAAAGDGPSRNAVSSSGGSPGAEPGAAAVPEEKLGLGDLLAGAMAAYRGM
ncbi:hypothetical protein [Pseudonocardia xishanensis]|uniref:GGDEF domain-containing protein n=1 Tax=Pseudonocardia xishanensis TaxID=630995 RepID=A0ABP8RYA2_9PSEU